ncbi:MAG: ABC transporter ATP-binding protein [Candidatus Dormibacteria bacterium]
MATVELDRVSKTYRHGAEAIRELTLSIDEGELMVLVGPSGCGKTTLLRMVAGLEEISKGEIRIGGRVVNDLSPKDRDIAMVFQNYALYPHLTVAENIGFSLRVRHRPKQEIAGKVDSVARLLGLREWLDRRPGQLSGGQRQRVAMGRAIIREPRVFLMDEPLSNLDARLRVQMRAEVSRLQRRLGVATIYVTHDQTEAMTMGDRVAVLLDGVLQQCAIPQVLYERPVNAFVANFIGSPAMNLYRATISDDRRSVSIGSQQLALSDPVHAGHPGLSTYGGRSVVLGIRPEHLALGSVGDGAVLRAGVELLEALGPETLVHFSLDAPAVAAPGQGPGVEPETWGVARIPAGSSLSVGEGLSFSVLPAHLHFFDPETGGSL